MFQTKANANLDPSNYRRFLQSQGPNTDVSSHSAHYALAELLKLMTNVSETGGPPMLKRHLSVS